MTTTTTPTPEIAFFTALSALQSDLPRIGKGQTAKVPTKAGGSYTYTYADLADIAAVILPRLSAEGLAFTSAGVMIEHGFVLRSSLVHVAGHREVSDYPLPDVSRSTPQDIGGAMTYGRRYSLCCLTGVTPGGDDDDASSASRPRSPSVPAYVSQVLRAITALPDEQKAALKAWWDEMELTTPEALSPEQAADVLDMIGQFNGGWPAAAEVQQ